MTTVALLAAVPLLGTAAAAARADSTSSSASSSTSEAQAALQKAAVAGERVEVTGERTEYSTTYANPDGATFTLDQSTAPVRVKQAGGGWATPDATLEVRSDGSVGPQATVADVSFSDGGDGSDLVKIAKGDRSLTLGWSGKLPAPTLDGANALYADVLPGVDLRMTATLEGFRELLIVKTPEAAANSALTKVEFSLKTDGLTVASAGGGGLRAVDEDGQSVLTAPAAQMWDSQGDADSSASTAPATSATASVRTAAYTQLTGADDADSTDPSSATADDDPTSGPGQGDASAVLPVQVTGDSLAVVPDVAILSNSDTSAFPVYIDPAFELDMTARTQLRSDGYTDYNWDNGDNGEGKGTGYCSSYAGYYCGPGYTERLYYQFAPNELVGKKVVDVIFRDTETWSFTCDPEWVDLERTGNISSGTTWSKRPNNLGVLASRHVSAGRGSACDPSQPAAPIEFSSDTLTDTVNDFAAGKFHRLTLLLKARDESTTAAWKRFKNNAALSVTYYGLPAVPNNVGVEDSGSCSTKLGDPQVIGDATPDLTALAEAAYGGRAAPKLRVKFYVAAKQSDGSWDVVTNPVRPTSGYMQTSGGEVTYPSPIGLSDGTVYRLTASTLSYPDDGGGSTESKTSAGCYFKVDTTGPQAPVVTVGDPYTRWGGLTDLTAHGGPGVSAQFTFAEASGDVNTAYEYKLSTMDDWASPISGRTVRPWITPKRKGLEVLQVRAMDAVGNPGDTAVVRFRVAEGAGSVARWHFDDGVPKASPKVTTAADTATEGSTRYPATLEGDGSSWSSLARRGDGDRSLALSDPAYADTAGPVVNTKASFTVSAWAYLTDTSAYRTVMSQTSSDGSGFALYYSPSAGWVFLWNWYENGVRKYQGANAAISDVSLAVWTHVTGVYDIGDRTISLYVNGRMQGSPVSLPSTSGATVVDGALEFGRASFTPGTYVNYWQGRIDEAAMWQRAIPADDAATEDRLLNSDGKSATELMADWDPDGASGTTLADSTSGYGRSLTLASGASLDGEAIVLDGTDDSAAAPGPVIDDTGSFTATTLVDVDSDALLKKSAGYTAQVLGQRTADGSSWGFWYQLTAFNADTGAPEGKWYFGRLDADGDFEGLVSDEAADLGSEVRLTGTYDAPTRAMHFYLGINENGADAPHTYSAAPGSGTFDVGKGYVGGAWGNHLPGKITDIRLWAGAMADQDQISTTVGS